MVKGYTRKVTYTRICDVCGKEFITKAHNSMYCSKECKYKVDNATRRGTEITKPLDQIELICENCKIKFKPTSKFVPYRKFCSDKCREQFHWRKYQNYQGGPRTAWNKGKKMSPELIEKSQSPHPKSKMI